MTTVETCGPCEYAAKENWWGPDHRGTHCRDCHRSWRGTAQAHCAGCHEHFSSTSTFDLHLSYCTGDPQTAHETLREASRKDGTPLLALSDMKDGPTWVRWHSGEHPFA